MYRHMKIQHTKERPHKCVSCISEFSTSDQLKSHYIKKHSTQRIRVHICTKCPLKFFTTAQLKAHFKRKHEPPRQNHFLCSQCGKRFYSKTELNAHRNSLAHSTIMCVFCDNGKFFYYNSESYRYHISKHTKERNICHFCPVEIRSKYNFEEHLKTHTG